MVADGGAVIEPECASGFGGRWSILLTFQKFKRTRSRAQEPSSATLLALLSNTGRTTTGKHHEESSPSDGRCSRIHRIFLRG